MRKFALIISIIGIGVLLGLLFKPPKTIESLDESKDGEVVFIEGIIDEVRNLNSGSMIILNEISVFCECKNIRAGKNAKIEGVVRI